MKKMNLFIVGAILLQSLLLQAGHQVSSPISSERYFISNGKLTVSGFVKGVSTHKKIDVITVYGQLNDEIFCERTQNCVGRLSIKDNMVMLNVKIDNDQDGNFEQTLPPQEVAVIENDQVIFSIQVDSAIVQDKYSIIEKAIGLKDKTYTVLNIKFI